MGIFSFLKNMRQEESLEETAPVTVTPPESEPETTAVEASDIEPPMPVVQYTVYYKNGHVDRAVPPLRNYYDERDVIYDATSIVSDGIAYDLTDTNSIAAIRAPVYYTSSTSRVAQELGVTGALDYTLRMRSARYWNEKKFDLAVSCLEKATMLMRHSDVGWQKRDYYRIVNELRDLGQLKKADQWKEWIESNIPDPAVDALKNRLADCKSSGTGLVEVGDSGVCCKKCAKYRKRVYSLSGRDKRFPKFPKDFHMDCGLSVWPYYDGISEPSFECQDVIAYSQRPFIDDRTADEIANREKWLSDVAKNQNYERQPDVGRITYYQLCQLLPDDVPKSMSAFSRMRNANSKKYQALVKKAEEKGYVFPHSIKDIEQGQTDALLNHAIECVLQAGQASEKLLSQQLSIGEKEAEYLMQKLEQQGIVGPSVGKRPRAVLLDWDEWQSN